MGGKLNKEHQVLLVACVFIGLFSYVYFVYLLNPTRALIKDRETKFASLTKQVEEAERQSRRLKGLQNEVEKLQTDLASLEKQLPTDKDIPGILRILTREALQQNLNFVSLRPMDPKRETYFDVLEFEVQMTGGFHPFAKFLASLGQQDRIFQVEQVKLSSSGSSQDPLGAQSLTISFQLKTYAYAG